MRDRRLRRLNRYQREPLEKGTIETIQHGEGLFVFRNKQSGTLTLPKPTKSGIKTVPPDGEWQGDNYYMGLVKTNEASLVRTILTPEQTKEMAMNEEKLILDQPETVTAEGTVEQVVEKKPQKLNEAAPTDPKKDVLLTEDPMDGVEIISE